MRIMPGTKLARREVLAGGASLAVALPPVSLVFAAERNAIWLTGNMVQGGLVMGRAGPGGRAWVDGSPVRVNDGLFCFGFGRDDTRPVEVRVAYSDGTGESKTVTPQRRQFDIQRVDGLPQQFVTPPPEVQARIARDAEAVYLARMEDSGETWFAEKFDWPCTGPITSVFGSQRILNGTPSDPHYGVDIAAPAGTPIHAPVNGFMRLAEDLYLSGNTMVIDHGHGVSTSYLHMSRIDVNAGDRVRRGQQLGLVGATGRATGPHLCWRMNWFQTRLDVALVAPPPDDKT